MNRSTVNVQITRKSKSLTNQHCFYNYIPFYFILQSVLFYNQLMSTKKKFPVCANFIQYTMRYQKIFWTKQTYIFTFITTFWTFHSPTTELLEFAKDPIKNLLHSKCFIFAIQSYSSALFTKKKSAFLKKKMSLYSTAWANFSKVFIKPTKCCRFHYPNLNLRFDSQKLKTNC